MNKEHRAVSSGLVEIRKAAISWPPKWQLRAPVSLLGDLEPCLMRYKFISGHSRGICAGVWERGCLGICHHFEILCGFRMHRKQLKRKRSMTRRMTGKAVFKAMCSFWLPEEVVGFARKSPRLDGMAPVEISLRMCDKSLLPQFPYL